jgi:hypothetical protein
LTTGSAAAVMLDVRPDVFAYGIRWFEKYQARQA